MTDQLRQSEPTNKSMLNADSGKLMINRLPLISYFCTKAPIPAIEMSTIVEPNPNQNFSSPSDKIMFSPLVIEFKLDEDLSNYIELYRWLVGMSVYPIGDIPVLLDSERFSDATLFTFTNFKKKNRIVKFVDLYPLALSQVDFDTQQTSVEYITMSASFGYRHFTIE
jgi:hypothetical protein